MNKLILLPLSIIIMLSILSVTYIPGTPLHGQLGEGPEPNSSHITISLGPGNPADTVKTFTFDNIIMAFAILTIAITGSALIGVSFLGSSLGTETTQHLIFNSILYLGIWAVFSILAYPLILEMWVFGGMIWLIITIIYVIGFANEISGSASA